MIHGISAISDKTVFHAVRSSHKGNFTVRIVCTQDFGNGNGRMDVSCGSPACQKYTHIFPPDVSVGCVMYGIWTE